MNVNFISNVQKVRLSILKSKIIDKFKPIIMNRCDTYFNLSILLYRDDCNHLSTDN